MRLEELKSQHEPVYKEVVEDNQYRISKADLCDKNILDIGANNGTFTVLAKTYGAKKIVAVESNVSAYRLLKSNTEGTDVIALNKAAAFNSGDKVIVGMQPEFGAIDGRCYVVPDSDGDIETISLHDLLGNFNGESVILKMDCEGSEYDIIYGASVEDLKKCQTILIEMHENIGLTAGKTGLINKLRVYLNNLGFTEMWADYYMDTRVNIFRFDFYKPEVTVVISEYLRPEYLVDQIEALQKQTLKPKDILVWQTQVEEYKELYNFENKYPNVHIIETKHDFNLPGRFAIPLLAKTEYVTLLDDDVFPAPKWLEECFSISKKYNAVVSPYGIKYDTNCNDLCSRQYGDNGEHPAEPVEVDMGGHGWFGKKAWFSFFWEEPVINEKIADDIHFSYLLKKHDIKTFVSPYPENNKDIWGNTNPDAGMGVKALHARKFEDEAIWKDVKRQGWDNSDFDYLKNNLSEFSAKRENVANKYKDMEKTLPVIDSKPKTKVNIPVTCVVSTKNRYFSTLPACLMSIALQTYKPKHLILLDDSDQFMNISQCEPIYSTIFYTLSVNGISWQHEPGAKAGQVANHIRSLEMADTAFVYRIDDDEILENDVLEKLVANMGDDVGAVAGLIIPAHEERNLPSIASNKMEDIFLGLNEQWFLHTDKTVKEVDHLYSSFLYRKEIAEYSTDLSPVGHREETLLTFGMKKKGYKLLIDPKAQTWHFRNPSGGIRSHTDPNNYAKDERVFSAKLQEWGIKPYEYYHVVLEGGIGDHFAFKYWLPEYFENNKNKKSIFYVCYPEVFKDIPNIQLASIEDAHVLMGNLDKFNIYSWMIQNKWDKSLCWAYKKMYNIKGGDIKVLDRFKEGTGNTIIISPYSFHKNHAKSYPYWNELIPLLKTLGYKLIQIGQGGEPALDGVDENLYNLSFTDVEKLLTDCKFWISGDNFLQHLNNNLPISTKGIVIWGESDSRIFGYPYNLNIFKDAKYLRPDQFGTWRGVDKQTGIWYERERNNETYDKETVVFEKIINSFK
jgi:FkbM family methyltransferase